jgi:hypothetical protein
VTDKHVAIDPLVTAIGEFPVLLVGELLDALEGVDRSTHVVVATEGWFDNVGEVVIPGGDAEAGDHMAVTLYPAGAMDPRQF